MPQKLFIGSLPTTITKAELSSFFSSYGNIQKIELILKRKTKAGRGFAFITMKSENAANKILRSQINFRGRQLTIRKHLKGQELDKNKASFAQRRMFVGGLPQRTSKKELINLFKKYGDIEKAYVITKTRSSAQSKPTNYGYVLFTFQHSLKHCVGKQFYLRGKYIDCQRYNPEEKDIKTRNHHQQPRNSSQLNSSSHQTEKLPKKKKMMPFQNRLMYNQFPCNYSSNSRSDIIPLSCSKAFKQKTLQNHKNQNSFQNSQKLLNAKNHHYQNHINRIKLDNNRKINLQNSNPAENYKGYHKFQAESNICLNKRVHYNHSFMNIRFNYLE